MFLYVSDEAAVHPVSQWVVGDLETPEGRLLLYQALRAAVS